MSSDHWDDDELRENLINAVARHLRENDQCGVGPLSEQEYLDDATAIVTTVRVIQKRANRLPEDTPCEHEWVDARNEVVASGEYCEFCGLLREGNQ